MFRFIGRVVAKQSTLDSELNELSSRERETLEDAVIKSFKKNGWGECPNDLI